MGVPFKKVPPYWQLLEFFFSLCVGIKPQTLLLFLPCSTVWATGIQHKSLVWYLRKLTAHLSSIRCTILSILYVSSSEKWQNLQSSRLNTKKCRPKFVKKRTNFQAEIKQDAEQPYGLDGWTSSPWTGKKDRIAFRCFQNHFTSQTERADQTAMSLPFVC